VYSAGIGEDISFDEALIGRAGCSVHAFDPTPRALKYVAARADLPPRFCVHAWGLWDQDAVVKFWAPQDPAHVSHSIGNLQATQEGFDAEVRTVASSMKALGHDHLDLLKLDIEGAEVEVLRQMLASDLRPAVLCVELDRPELLTNLRLLGCLRRAGYQLIHLEHRNVTMVHQSALGDSSRGAAPGAIDSE
jgi:FkbM family methyltransferase